MRTINFTIDESKNNWSIKDFLKNFGVSSSLLTRLKNDDNGIQLNGKHAKTIDLLKTGDILTINIANRGKRPSVSNAQLEVVYNDEDLIIVNKPPFMPCHESRNHIGDTLSNAVAKYLNEDCAYRCVFRLDRDTSGLVLIAKNELSAAKLAGKIKKDYYAIVSGTISSSGTIDKSISRVGDSIIKRKVSTDGERAVTHFEPVSTHNNMTLLKINLETGRTHQIRVHFADLGFPLVGDTLYGNESSLINRQALHCKAIYFTHPITNKDYTIEIDFPNDMKKLMEG